MASTPLSLSPRFSSQEFPHLKALFVFLFFVSSYGLFLPVAADTARSGTAAVAVLDGGAAAGRSGAYWTYPEDALRRFGASATAVVAVDVVLTNFGFAGRGAGMALDVANFSAAVVFLPPSQGSGAVGGGVAAATLTLRDSTFVGLAALVVVGAVGPSVSPAAASSRLSLTVTIANVTLTDSLLLLRDLGGGGGALPGLSITLANVTALWQQQVPVKDVVPSPALPDDWDSDTMATVVAPLVVYNATLRSLLLLDSSFAARLPPPAPTFHVAALYFPYPFVLADGAHFLVGRTTVSAVISSSTCSPARATNVYAIRHSAPVALARGSTYALRGSTVHAVSSCGWAAGQLFYATRASLASNTTAAAAVVTSGSALLWINCTVTVEALAVTLPGTPGSGNAYGQYFSSSVLPPAVTAPPTRSRIGDAPVLAAVALSGGSAVLWAGCSVAVTSHNSNDAHAQGAVVDYTGAGTALWAGVPNTTSVAAAAVLSGGSFVLWATCDVAATALARGGSAAAQSFWVTYSSGSDDGTATGVAAAHLGEGSALLWANSRVTLRSENFANNFESYAQSFSLFFVSTAVIGNATAAGAVTALFLSEGSVLLWTNCSVVVTANNYNSKGGNAYAQLFRLRQSPSFVGDADVGAAAFLGATSALVWVNCTVAVTAGNPFAAYGQCYSLAFGGAAPQRRALAALAVAGGSAALWYGCRVTLLARFGIAAGVWAGTSGSVAWGVLVDGTGSTFGIVGGSNVTLTAAECHGAVWLGTTGGALRNGRWVLARLGFIGSGSTPLVLDAGGVALQTGGDETAGGTNATGRPVGWGNLLVRCVDANGRAVASVADAVMVVGGGAVPFAPGTTVDVLPCTAPPAPSACDSRTDCGPGAIAAAAVDPGEGGSCRCQCGGSPSNITVLEGDCSLLGPYRGTIERGLAVGAAFLLAAADGGGHAASHRRSSTSSLSILSPKATATATSAATATSPRPPPSGRWRSGTATVVSRSAPLPPTAPAAAATPRTTSGPPPLGAGPTGAVAAVVSREAAAVAVAAGTATAGSNGVAFGPALSAQAARSGLLSALALCDAAAGGAGASLAPDATAYVYSTPSSPPSMAWPFFAGPATASGGDASATVASAMASHASGVVVTMAVTVAALALAGFRDCHR